MKPIFFSIFLFLCLGFTPDQLDKWVKNEEQIRNILMESIKGIVAEGYYNIVVSASGEEQEKQYLEESTTIDKSKQEHIESLPGFESKIKKKKVPDIQEVSKKFKNFNEFHFKSLFITVLFFKEEIPSDRQDLIKQIIKNKLQGIQNTPIKIDYKFIKNDIFPEKEEPLKKEEKSENFFKENLMPLIWVSIFFMMILIIILLLKRKNNNNVEQKNTTKEDVQNKGNDHQSLDDQKSLDLIYNFLVESPDLFSYFISSLSEHHKEQIINHMASTPLAEAFSESTKIQFSKENQKFQKATDLKDISSFIHPFKEWKNIKEKTSMINNQENSSSENFLRIFKKFKLDMQIKIFSFIPSSNKKNLIASLLSEDKTLILKGLIQEDQTFEKSLDHLSTMTSIEEAMESIKNTSKMRNAIQTAIEILCHWDLDIENTIKNAHLNDDMTSFYKLHNYLIGIDDIFRDPLSQSFSKTIENTSNFSLAVIAHSLLQQDKDRLLSCLKGVRKKAVENLMMSLKEHTPEDYLSSKKEILEQYRKFLV